VKRAGGLFMIIMDTPDSNQGYSAVTYGLPTIHLPVQARTTVISYAMQARNPTAQYVGRTIRYDAVAPAMARFSSRGPVPVANGAVMKPDVTAPGEWKRLCNLPQDPQLALDRCVALLIMIHVESNSHPLPSSDQGNVACAWQSLLAQAPGKCQTCRSRKEIWSLY